jgi:succinyl-diaminopimelate desuccinylase
VGRPSNAFLSPRSEGVALLARVIAERIGTAPEFSTAGGTSDARFIAPYCPVVELGLPGPSMHKVDEHVSVRDVEALRRIYGVFVQRYLRG